MIFDTLLAEENWRTKYKYGDEDPLETFVRVAREVAEVEAEYGATDEEVEEKFEEFLTTLVEFEKASEADIDDQDVIDLSDGRYRAIGLSATPGGRITANAGTDYEETTLWNCLQGDERVVTEKGVEKISNLSGTSQSVLTETGWVQAEIKSFGEDFFDKITLKPCKKSSIGHLNGKDSNATAYRRVRSNLQKEVLATSDHRWVKHDGTVTKNLKEGDVVKSNTGNVEASDLEDSESYREAFRHGLIFGDGYVNNEHSDGTITFGIRLCTNLKSSYKSLFDNVTYPSSYDGDPFCSIKRTSKNYKSLPGSKDPSYIKGFIDGWNSADGHTYDNGNFKIFSQDSEALCWLEEHSVYAGYLPVGFHESDVKSTNFGERSSSLEGLMLTSDPSYEWKVVSIERRFEEGESYCAQVPEEHAFTLAGGLYTGNCFINGPVSDAQVEYDRPVPNSDEEIHSLLESEQTPDNLTNIFLSLLEAAETLKSEGGYGINFGFIRPRGTLIEGVGIRHPGVVSYMEMWDKMSEIIVKGDNDGYEDELTNHLDDPEDVANKLEKAMPRKGAMLAALPVWHPDIEEYIKSKQESGRLTKFNISVLIDDAFMEAVENDDFYDLHFDGETYKRVKARKLYDLIMESTYCLPGDRTIPVVNEDLNEVEMKDLETLHREFDEGDVHYSSLSIDPDSLESSENRIEDVIHMGQKETMEIHTRSGVIETTPTHTLFGAEEGNSFKEKLAEEFEEDDWVAVSDTLSFNQDSLKEDAIDPEMAFFAGVVMGDGNVRRNLKTIRLFCHEDDAYYLEDSFDYLRDKYDVSVRKHRREDEDTLYHSISSSELWSLFRYDYEMGSGEDKQVPQEIMELNDPDLIAEFLSGLYCADGFLSNEKTVFYTSKKDIAKDVQTLLMRLGIRSCCSKTTKETDSGVYVGWNLYLKKEDSKRFQALIDFPLERKNACVDTPRSSGLYPIACEGFEKIASRNGRTSVSNFSNETAERLEKGSLRFEKVQKVVSSEGGSKEVYDLSMEGHENFVDSMGYVYHNCRNEPGCIFFDNSNRKNPLLYLGPNAGTNPCVTGDTWINTSMGPRQVEELHQRPFTALVNGEEYDTVSDGFWKTGEKEVYQLETKKGYTVKATEDHPFLKTASEEDSTWTDLGDLEEGDVIHLSSHKGEASSSWSGKGIFEEGWLLGYLIGDGTLRDRKNYRSACLDFWGDDVETLLEIAKDYMEYCSINTRYISEGGSKSRIESTELYELGEEFGITYEEKVNISNVIHRSSSDFQKGLVRGLFDADGCVQTRGRSNPSPVVKLSQSNSEFLQEVQKILSRFGVICTLYRNRGEAHSKKMPNGKGGAKVYDCQAQHEIYITKDNMKRFSNLIGFSDGPKKRLLSKKLSEYQKGPKSESYVDEIKSIDRSGVEDVYDVTIEDVHEFGANGVRARNCGEIPGSTFVDKHYEGADYLEPYLSDEEHHLGFTTVCLLGSVNLTRFINEDRTFDWDAYKETVSTFARMLENVNDIDMAPLPAYRWAIENIRQYGMGINGLGSALYMLGMKYGSDEAVEFTEKVNQIKDELTLKESALLAKDRGPFPMYDERYLETPYFEDHCKASEEVKDLVREYGVRNAKRLTNPPLGSSSVICDNVSNGIEPVFNHEYERTVIADDWPKGLNRDNVEDKLDKTQVGDTTAWRGEYGDRIWYWEPQNRGLCFVEKVRDYGYQWIMDHYPEDIEEDADYLATSQTLDIDAHVRMQEKVQDYCDQSVSKTSNLPNDYPFDDFKSLYKDAWEAGLVGFTTFRAGTMETVLDTNEEDDGTAHDSLLNLYKDRDLVPPDVETTDDDVIVRNVHLPDEFSNGQTEKVRGDGNKYYMHLSYLPGDDQFPVAFWIHSNELEDKEYVSLNRAVKAIQELLHDMGVDTRLVIDYTDKISDDHHHVRLGKMISMALRHNIGLPNIVSSIEEIEGDYVASTLTAVRKFLKERIEDGTQVRGATCNECGSENIVFESGCDKCLDCGSSSCG
jgi:ribonucleoside-diphosphate reductase alpha chain